MALKTLLSSTALVALLSTPPAPAPETWKVDPVHSSVVFKVKHLGVANFYGRFNEITGTIVIDDAQPEKSSIEVAIPVDSIDTREPKRDQHLKSPDFFNAQQFPKITFKSKSVKKAGDKWSVTGDLTLHGVTKELTVELERTGSGKGMQGEMRTGGETSFTIKRSDYGMTFMLPDAVGDEVTLRISVEAVKG